jgi:hypothetical protein
VGCAGGGIRRVVGWWEGTFVKCLGCVCKTTTSASVYKLILVGGLMCKKKNGVFVRSECGVPIHNF